MAVSTVIASMNTKRQGRSTPLLINDVDKQRVRVRRKTACGPITEVEDRGVSDVCRGWPRRANARGPLGG
jgi:hypothetical protein